MIIVCKIIHLKLINSKCCWQCKTSNIDNNNLRLILFLVRGRGSGWVGLDEDSGVSQHKLGYPLGFYTKLQSQNTIKQLLEPTIIRGTTDQIWYSWAGKFQNSLITRLLMIAISSLLVWCWYRHANVIKLQLNYWFLKSKLNNRDEQPLTLSKTSSKKHL